MLINIMYLRAHTENYLMIKFSTPLNKNFMGDYELDKY